MPLLRLRCVLAHALNVALHYGTYGARGHASLHSALPPVFQLGLFYGIPQLVETLRIEAL